MSDRGHELTDDLLFDMERKIRKEYFQAVQETQKKLDNYLEQFEAKDLKWQKDVADGVKTAEQYQTWRYNQITTGDRWAQMVDTLAEDYHNSNMIARSTIDGYMPDVYALNHNYATYEVEKNCRVDTSYTLYDHQTVERLMREDPELLPPPGKSMQKKIKDNPDIAWQKGQIQSVTTQAILQGESIPNMAKRICTTMGETNMKSAERYARTSTTGAENAGRVDAYKRAKAMGLNIRQVWVATLDNRTRHAHRQLDGEKTEVGEPFVFGRVEIRFPGDPTCSDPSLIWNCRCTLISERKGHERDLSDLSNRNTDNLDGMSYDEWKAGKEKEAEVAPPELRPETTVVDGKDLTGTWERRKDQFDFEIEDVLNAQGFDGLPRVVSREEFDRYVQEANGGKGFIAQRTYSGSTQEVVGAYRDQLYNGDWYVDCSTGGAQYGQGMYCAADYTGKLSKGIKEEMAHYKDLNQMRGNAYALTETMTLDKSAKVIKYTDLADMQRMEGSRGNFFTEKIRNANLTDDEMAFAVHYYGRALWNATSGFDADVLNRAYEAYDRIMDLPILEGDAIEESFWKKMGSKNLEKELKQYEKEAAKLQKMNKGSYAALKGYDAINAEGHGQSGSYTVVLNRTKCIFLGE